MRVLLCFCLFKSEGLRCHTANMIAMCVCLCLSRSEGLRCYTAKFDHYVDEQCQFIRLAGEQGMPGFPPILPADAPAPPSTTSGVKPVPRYLLGASKGGCLATVIALRMVSVVHACTTHRKCTWYGLCCVCVCVCVCVATVLALRMVSVRCT